MNRALIDTDILSYYFKGDPLVVENFKKYLTEYWKLLRIWQFQL